jgi:hypothetical protein
MADPIEEMLVKKYGDQAAKALQQDAAYAEPAFAGPPEPLSPSDPIDALYKSREEQATRDEQDKIRETQILKFQAENTKLSPGQAAEVARMAAIVPGDLGYIAENLEKVKKQALSAQLDFDHIVKQHPVLAKYIGDPKNVAQSIDDSATLRGVEAAVSGRWETYRAEDDILDWGTGEFIPAKSKVYRMITPPAWGAAVRDAFLSDVPLMTKQTEDYLGIGNEKLSWASGLPQFVPMTVKEVSQRDATIRMLRDDSTAYKDYLGPGVTSEGWSAKRVIANTFLFPAKISPVLLGTAVAVPAATAVGLSEFAGMFAANLLYTLPSTYEKMAGLTNMKTGEQIAPEDARLATTVAAPLLAWIMSKGLSNTLLKGTEKAIEQAGASTLKRALGDKSLLRSITEFTARAGVHVGEGAVGFAMQSGVDAGLEILTRSWALGEQASVEDRKLVYAAMWEGFKQGALDMIALSMWGPGRELVGDFGRMKRAHETATRLRIMSDATEAAKHPELVDQFKKETAAQPGAAKNLYVDRATFDETARQMGQDPAALAAEVMQDGGAHYAEAVSQGAADLVIPIDRVSGKLNTRFKGFSDLIVAEGRLDPSDSSLGKVARDVNRWLKKAKEVAEQSADKMDEEVKSIYEKEREKASKVLIKVKDMTPERAELMADAHARKTLAIVMTFRERTGAKATLTEWYDKTFGDVGIWPAQLREQAAITMEEKFPVGKEVAFQKPDGLWAPGKIVAWNLDGTVEIVKDSGGRTTITPDKIASEFGNKLVTKLILEPKTLINKYTEVQLVEEKLAGTTGPGNWAGVVISFFGKTELLPRKWERVAGQVDHLGREIISQSGSWRVVKTPDGAFALQEIINGAPTSGGRFNTEEEAKEAVGPVAKHPQPRPQILIRTDMPQSKAILAHEFMHAVSRVVLNLATEPGAKPEMIALHDQMAEAMGYKATADKPAGQVRIRESRSELEERLAHAFEQFLFEGKSPSVALAPVFDRFMRWGAQIAKAYGYDVSEHAQKRLLSRFPGLETEFSHKILASPEQGPGGAAPPGQYPVLNEKLREFFRTMLVSVEETKAAQDTVKAGEPIPDLIKSMTPEEQKEYEALFKGLPQTAQEILLKRIAEATRSENSKFLRKEFDRFKAQVLAETAEDPVYNAIHFFRTGKFTAKSMQKDFADLFTAPDGRPYRIFYGDLEKYFGKEASVVAESLRQLHSKMVTKDPTNGMDLELFVQSLGLVTDANRPISDAVERLFAGLKTALPEVEHVERTAMARLREAYQTDLIDQPEALRQRALDAVINEKLARKVILEMNALARSLDVDRAQRTKSITKGQLADLADKLVLNKALRNIRPEDFTRAIANASIRAREFIKADNNAKAWDESEMIALNIHMYMASRKIYDSMNKALAELENRAGGDSWRSKLGMADQSMRIRDFHDGLLQAVGIREVGRGEERLTAKTLEGFLEVAREHGLDSSVGGWDVDVVTELFTGNRTWKDLTPFEAINVFKAVKNARFIADQINEVRIGEWKETLDKIRSDFTTDLERLPFIGKAPADLALVPKGREPKLQLQSADANGLELQTILEMIGPNAKRIVWEPYKKALANKGALQKLVQEKFNEAYESMPKELRNRWNEELPSLVSELPIPDGVNLSGPRSRSWLWMVALNMGNEGNRLRLLGGMGWNEGQVIDALQKHLSPAEMNFVQKVWDLSDTHLWPKILEKERRRYGLDPEKVVAMPLVLKFTDPVSGMITEHEYRGGYFAAKYDPRVSGRQMVAEQRSVEDGQVRMRPGTNKSYTKPRADHFVDIVNLDWGVVPSHFSEVVHDLAFDEFVRATNRIFFDKKINDTMYQRLGEERAKQPRAWLETVAKEYESISAAHLARAMGLLEGGKSRLVYGALGYSLTVPLADFLHPIAVAFFGRVSGVEIAKSMAQTLNPTEYAAMRKFAEENSAMIRSRAEHSNVKLREELLIAARGGKPGVLGEAGDFVRKHAFMFLDFTDRIVSTQIWTAKYREVMKKTSDHEKAVSAADDLLTGTMPSHTLGMMPAFLRDRQKFGPLLIFFGYYSKLYQMSRLNAHEAYLAHADAKVTGDYGKAFGTTAAAAARIMAGLGVASVLGDYFMGHGKERDESWGQWWARKSLAAPFGMIPFASNVAEPLADTIVTGRPRRGSIKQAPYYAFLEHFVTTTAKLASNKRTDQQKMWDLIEAALFASRLPARQVRRTGEYLTDVATETAQPRGVLDFTSHAIYGERRRQPANPIQDLADLFEE